MSTFSRALLGAAGAAALAGAMMSPAMAEDRAPSAYIGAGGGLNFLTDMDFTSPAKVTSDTGWAAIGSLGYRWAGGLRTEIEGGVRGNQGHYQTPANENGKVRAETILGNALFDIFPSGKFTPYIGFGVGVARPKFDFPTASVRDTALAYQGIVGATLKVTERLDLFMDYRYLSTSGLDVTIGPNKSVDEYRTHTALAGLRWTFWSGAAKPAPAPAAAPAPVMSTPKDYTIYFEFDKSNITDAAGAVLDEIKTNTQPGQSYSVVGHTDTSGSIQYNQALSDRRAKNTASGLTTRGVTVSNVSGVGKTDLAVPTADGVKEPLNRRSVIKVNQ